VTRRPSPVAVAVKDHVYDYDYERRPPLNVFVRRVRETCSLDVRVRVRVRGTAQPVRPSICAEGAGDAHAHV
jgi:hypothetical protein